MGFTHDGGSGSIELASEGSDGERDTEKVQCVTGPGKPALQRSKGGPQGRVKECVRRPELGPLNPGEATEGRDDGCIAGRFSARDELRDDR